MVLFNYTMMIYVILAVIIAVVVGALSTIVLIRRAIYLSRVKGLMLSDNNDKYYRLVKSFAIHQSWANIARLNLLASCILAIIAPIWAVIQYWGQVKDFIKSAVGQNIDQDINWASVAIIVSIFLLWLLIIRILITNFQRASEVYHSLWWSQLIIDNLDAINDHLIKNEKFKNIKDEKSAKLTNERSINLYYDLMQSVLTRPKFLVDVTGDDNDIDKLINKIIKRLKD